MSAMWSTTGRPVAAVSIRAFTSGMLRLIAMRRPLMNVWTAARPCKARTISRCFMTRSTARSRRTRRRRSGAGRARRRQRSRGRRGSCVVALAADVVAELGLGVDGLASGVDVVAAVDVGGDPDHNAGDDDPADDAGVLTEADGAERPGADGGEHEEGEDADLALEHLAPTLHLGLADGAHLAVPAVVLVEVAVEDGLGVVGVEVVGEGRVVEGRGQEGIASAPTTATADGDELLHITRYRTSDDGARSHDRAISLSCRTLKACNCGMEAAGRSGALVSVERLRQGLLGRTQRGRPVL